MSPEPPNPRRVAIVTGGGSGIGRAIALGLAAEGATVGLVGRRLDALDAVGREIERHGARAVRFQADLVAAGEADRLGGRITAELGAADLLVQSAGIFPFTPADAAAAWEHVHAAEALTRALLPLLRIGPGQLVFVNSSRGLPGVAASGVYAESKQALRALADRLRAELNPEGIRVLSVYPGRTASPMQAAIHRDEGRPYRPERLLQPEDVAAVVLHSLGLPRTAEVTDVSIRPLRGPETG